MSVPAQSAELLDSGSPIAAALHNPRSGAADRATLNGSVPKRRARPAIMRQYELVELVKAYDPSADEDLLNRAYVFAMRAHGTQKRASGDPYFHHPVEVAGLLAGYKLDTATIATGLLHDTVEDTGVSLDEIGTLFGETVRRLVDGVTKLSKLEVQSARAAQGENFRKLLLAMSDDIRVLLVKLADRLHNMRTLHFIADAEKRARIAAETMDIYAPLAERIGMEKLKAELENLAFAELAPEAYQSITHRLGQLRADDAGLVQRIESALKSRLDQAGIVAEVTGREKSPRSIWRKMERKNISFEQLADIMAFRVVTASVADCYAALGVIHEGHAVLPGRFKDYISTPKPNGYRSLHTTIIGPEQVKIEVQIRTSEMHEVAELGVAAHWAYKQDERATEGRRYRWVRELLDILEQTSGPEEFLEHTKLEMFQDQVFCFTPRGDLFSLPHGATPVDFAYAVHSEIGDHCVGAKVDGRIVQLRTVLENGDQVEIITSRSARPSPAWERFVVTGKARARIRRHLRAQRRDENIDRGRQTIQRLARTEGRHYGDKDLERAVAELKQRSVDDLLVAVAEGQLSARQVLEIVAPTPAGTPADDDRQALGKIHASRRARGDEPIEDQSCAILGLPRGVDFAYARCCRPIPGDPIVGVIRTGRPVSIHRHDCSTYARMNSAEHRFIDVGWNNRMQIQPGPARLAVMVSNQKGALGTISTVIGQQDGNITDIKVGRRADDLYEMLLDVEVQNLDKLLSLQAALRTISIVSSVERVQS